MVNIDGQTNEWMEEQTESWPPTSCHAIVIVSISKYEYAACFSFQIS